MQARMVGDLQVKQDGGRMKTVKTLLTGIPRIEYILGLLIALVVSDGLITEFLTGSGLGREGNPFLQPFMVEGGLLLVKMAGALLSALILWDIYRRQPNLALISSLFFVAFYTGIVYWNLAIFFISQV